VRNGLSNECHEIYTILSCALDSDKNLTELGLNFCLLQSLEIFMKELKMILWMLFYFIQIYISFLNFRMSMIGLALLAADVIGWLICFC
jgi:hypothetical protein